MLLPARDAVNSARPFGTCRYLGTTGLSAPSRCHV